VPTLAFNVAGVRDSVEDGVTGLLATDERNFESKWIELARESTLRLNMASAAQARAATFTWDRAVDLFEQVLESAVPGR
jgi:glycosyltransferase involved in cell wall biosynthesis